ncbi:hypothetical protein [Pseudarthrobacter sp. SSS035]|uniref:hypothetical protein n=1 Tax=Pseudarthrobacter sp. SSS035 TaxID=2931399 RepID=UPI00200F6F57|nr:hypothetical protein [Pseudarthrobacter sp. SSS035]
MTYIPSAPRFHSPSAPLRAALSALPGYDEHVAAVEALKAPHAAAVREQTFAKTALDNIAGDLADALLGTPDDAPAAIEASTTQATAAADAARTTATAVELIEATEKQLGIDLDDIIRSGYDRILKHLNGILQDDYAKSRKLGLRGIHDAEQAIEAGKADAWSAMLEIRANIFHVRAAQSSIVGRLGSHETVQRINTFGLLANYAELWPGWFESQAGARWGREDITPPWPTIRGDIDPAELHAWILDTPDAEPWVPTSAELTAAVKAAEQAAREDLAKQDA